METQEFPYGTDLESIDKKDGTVRMSLGEEPSELEPRPLHSVAVQRALGSERIDGPRSVYRHRNLQPTHTTPINSYCKDEDWLLW